MSGRALADVLIVHNRQLIEGMGLVICSCEAWALERPIRRTAPQHAEHVADAVTAWLGERLAGAREDVAAAIGELPPGLDLEDDADAALDVVRRALGIEVRG